MIVTVVTPTLNASQYLEACIASAKRNNSENVTVEHVIVDGGSTDDTVAIAERHGLTVLHGKDKGIFDAINKGSRNSSGELLGFLGADDLMLEGALDAVVEGYRKSGRRWVVGGIRWIDERGAGMGFLAAPPVWMNQRMHVCLGWNPIMHMSTYLARDFYEELDGFDIAFRDAGDYDMFTRALGKAPFHRLSRPLACFRLTGRNNSATNRARTQVEIARIRLRFGPGSAAEAALWRWALKAWFNGRNPDWLVSKIAEHGRVRLGLPQTVHF